MAELAAAAPAASASSRAVWPHARSQAARARAGGASDRTGATTVRVSPFSQSRTAPPSSGGGLWFVRLIALAVVALLGAAVVR